MVRKVNAPRVPTIKQTVNNVQAELPGADVPTMYDIAADLEKAIDEQYPREDIDVLVNHTTITVTPPQPRQNLLGELAALVSNHVMNPEQTESDWTGTLDGGKRPRPKRRKGK